MTYKTILLHLHDLKRAQRLLEVAVPLARRMDAHLIGLAVLPAIIIIPGMDSGGTSVIIEDHRDAYRGEMAKLKAVFNEVTKGQSLKTEWREDDANASTAADVIIKHGRSVDLIIASQKKTDWNYSSMLEEPERIAIESGRPVLLVPNKGTVTMPPKRVTVAWNDRREAARAVFDALPLLKGTDEVNIVWVNPEREPFAAGDLPGAELAVTLNRHGVKCQVSQASALGVDVGAELLRQARVFGSDLLVMGAYGHSRTREFLLGGASRDALAKMDRLVLMSH